MASYIQIADKLRSELQRHKAFSDAAEMFEKLGSIEQATDEAQQKLAKVRAELDTYQKNLDHLKATAGAEVESAKKEAAALRQSAHREAEEAKRSASLDCDNWRSKAKEDAARIVAEAQAKAGAEINAAASQASQHRVAAENARSQYDALQKQIDGKAAELASLDGKIAKAKEQIKSMLGG